MHLGGISRKYSAVSNVFDKKMEWGWNFRPRL